MEWFFFFLFKHLGPGMASVALPGISFHKPQGQRPWTKKKLAFFSFSLCILLKLLKYSRIKRRMTWVFFCREGWFKRNLEWDLAALCQGQGTGITNYLYPAVKHETGFAGLTPAAVSPHVWHRELYVGALLKSLLGQGALQAGRIIVRRAFWRGLVHRQ